MTDRQAFALNNIIEDSEDIAALPGHATILTLGIRRFGTILTVDHANEFRWHVCVSLLNSEVMPRRLDKLSSEDKVATLALALELLSEVGQPDCDDIHEEERSLHITRRLTIREERRARESVKAASYL